MYEFASYVTKISLRIAHTVKEMSVPLVTEIMV
jgi:hypothetical protein